MKSLKDTYTQINENSCFQFAYSYITGYNLRPYTELGFNTYFTNLFSKTEIELCLEKFMFLENKVQSRVNTNTKLNTSCLSKIPKDKVESFKSSNNLNLVKTLEQSNLVAIDKHLFDNLKSKLSKKLSLFDGVPGILGVKPICLFEITFKQEKQLEEFYNLFCVNSYPQLQVFNPNNFLHVDLQVNPFKVYCTIDTFDVDSILSSLLVYTHTFNVLFPCFRLLNIFHYLDLTTVDFSRLNNIETIATLNKDVVWDSTLVEICNLKGFEITEDNFLMLLEMLKSPDIDLAFEILTTVNLQKYELEVFILLLLSDFNLYGKSNRITLKNYFKGKNLNVSPPIDVVHNLNSMLKLICGKYPISNPHNKKWVEKFTTLYLNKYRIHDFKLQSVVFE